MTSSKFFPFVETSNSGVLQYLKTNEKTDNIIFDHSPCATTTNIASKVLTLDDDYFCSVTNTINNTNFFTVALSNMFFYAKGYIIKSDITPDAYFLRSWKLYGSLYGTEWKLLHSINEQDVLAGGKIGRYEIKGGPFKHFKIVQTGPCYGSNNDVKYRLRICYIDFFGLMTTRLNIGKTCKRTMKSTKLLIVLSTVMINS